MNPPFAVQVQDILGLDISMESPALVAETMKKCQLGLQDLMAHENPRPISSDNPISSSKTPSIHLLGVTEH